MSATKTKVLPTGNNAAALLPHPLAETVPGEMTGEEFTALCASIKADGLRNPITLYEGKILDGRARYAAMQKLEITTVGHTVTFDGPEAEATAFVMDNNLHRRQLSSMQKAIVGARMTLRKEKPLSQRDAATAVGVSPTTINLASRLLETKNTPLIKRCEHGEATRAELEEILYDRELSQQQASVLPTGNSAAGAPLPSNVVPIGGSGSGVIAGKREKTKRATETPASIAVRHFKELDSKTQAAFCTMAWQWLEPALVNAGKLPKPAKAAAKKHKAA